jgi:hypothetical protein
VGEDRTSAETSPPKRRYTVAEASRILNTTAEAVRSRIKRGTVESVKEGRTVYVLLGLDQTPPEQRLDDAPTIDRTHPDELISMLREQIAYLQGVIATRDRELATRAEEIRRRDAALEREQQLTAGFAERLRALEAPVQGAEGRETPPQGQGQVASPVIRATTGTRILFAACAGVLAAFAHPLLISSMDNPLRLALLVLGALPAVFGMWLGQTTASSMAATYAELEALRRDPLSPTLEPPDLIEVLERRLAALPSKLPIYAVSVGALTGISSLFGYELGQGSIDPDVVFVVALTQGFVAAMFVLFGGLFGLGRERQRQQEVLARAGAGTTAEAETAKTQASIGLIGTIITAILSFAGVVVQVIGSSGGNGG